MNDYMIHHMIHYDTINVTTMTIYDAYDCQVNRPSLPARGKRSWHRIGLPGITWLSRRKGDSDKFLCLSMLIHIYSHCTSFIFAMSAAHTWTDTGLCGICRKHAKRDCHSQDMPRAVSTFYEVFPVCTLMLASRAVSKGRDAAKQNAVTPGSSVMRPKCAPLPWSHLPCHPCLIRQCTSLTFPLSLLRLWSNFPLDQKWFAFHIIFHIMLYLVSDSQITWHLTSSYLILPWCLTYLVPCPSGVRFCLAGSDMVGRNRGRLLAWSR